MTHTECKHLFLLITLLHQPKQEENQLSETLKVHILRELMETTATKKKYVMHFRKCPSRYLSFSCVVENATENVCGAK